MWTKDVMIVTTLSSSKVYSEQSTLLKPHMWTKGIIIPPKESLHHTTVLMEKNCQGQHSSSSSLLNRNAIGKCC
jgi:hypothetical protein